MVDIKNRFLPYVETKMSGHDWWGCYDVSLFLMQEVYLIVLLADLN